MILHIPHASTNTLDLSLADKAQELLRLTDHFTDELYEYKDATSLVFGVSRLICDVERFKDDTQENMSKYGMGVCYTKTTDGEKLRDVSDEQREYLVKNYYDVHHQRLSNEVDGELEQYNASLIVDCHSFPDTTSYFHSDHGKRRPDICLGTDSFHTPKKLLELVKVYFLSKGYEVAVNSPYGGTMVPLKHYKKDERVHSIMIELNRRLYIDEDGYKIEHFNELQSELQEVLKIANSYMENQAYDIAC